MKEHMTKDEIRRLKRTGTVMVIFIWIMGIFTGINLKGMMD